MIVLVSILGMLFSVSSSWANNDLNNLSIKELVKKDLGLIKTVIEDKLNIRLPCQNYSDFLFYNKNDFSEFNVDFDKLNSQCSNFPLISNQLAHIYYEFQNYNTAFKYAKKGCKKGVYSNKSEGCDLLAMMTIQGQTINSPEMSYNEKMMVAIDYLQIGHEMGDIKSSAFLHDIYNKSILFSSFGNPKEAKAIYSILKQSKELAAKIQVQKSCFSEDHIKRIFNSCIPVCRWALRINKRNNTDVVSRYLLASVFKDNVCEAELNKPLNRQIASDYPNSDLSTGLPEGKYFKINKSKNPAVRPLAKLKDDIVCYNATSKLVYKKIWNIKNDNFVGEAKYRGLNCGVKEDNKTVIASNRNQNSANIKLEQYSNREVCSKATQRKMIGDKILEIWNIINNPNFVEEAKKRGLDCRVKGNNSTLIASKAKIKSLTQPKSAISSTELDKEKQRRIALQRKADEEGLKRKALEQRIAELEKKNKELSKPKKQKPLKPKSSSGSGFFISKLGHIITNNHVVNECSTITVGDSIDKQVPAKLLETDKRNDLALLRTTTLKMASAETKSLIQKLSIYIPLATGGLMRGNDIELGEDVLVAGFPYGDIFSKNIKVTKGIVSSTTGVGDDSGQFQLDAAVQPGNSGGPIYDKYGNIVGVVVAQLNKLKMAKTIGSFPENVNFGIKASTVKQFLNTSGLPTKWSEKKESMSNQELSKIASKQTVMVVCHRN